jgi:hypothetical protein
LRILLVNTSHFYGGGDSTYTFNLAELLRFKGRIAAFFADAFTDYNAWLGGSKPPRVTIIESSPLDEIAYGYDYRPWDYNLPPSPFVIFRSIVGMHKHTCLMHLSFRNV